MAQDRGYQGAADVAGFGSQVPGPGDFTTTASTAFKAAQELELAEALADRGDFVKADEHWHNGWLGVLNLNGTPFISYAINWPDLAKNYIDSLRPREAALKQEAATSDAELVNQNEAYNTSPEADAARADNANVAHLMDEKAKGATDDQLQSEYNFGTSALAPLTAPGQEKVKATIEDALPTIKKVAAAAGIASTAGLVAVAAVALIALVFVVRGRI